jgi:hypothetical protein
MCAGLDQELVRSEAGLTVIWLLLWIPLQLPDCRWELFGVW